MIDKDAREAIARLTHVIEQQITLSGNHLYGAALKPELAALRKMVGAAEQDPITFTPVPHQNATMPHGVEVVPPALAIAQGRAGLPIMSAASNVEVVGCKGCNRTADELVAQGHAAECASIKSAKTVSV